MKLIIRIALVMIPPVCLVGCPGVDLPNELFSWIDDQLEQALDRYQKSGELPPERCIGETLGKGIYCPEKSKEYILAPFNQSASPNGRLSGYVKGLGRAEGDFIATIATSTTYNRSVEHHHQPATTRASGSCDMRWVQWVTDVNQSTSLSMDGKIGGQAYNGGVNIGNAGSRSGIRLCNREEHADPRECIQD